jgi:glycosyltransferase involved in cell wall biosynthesis
LDLHVLASLTEGFPNVVAETMLSAVPNVVTNVGDSGVIVGETGWIAPAGDPERLAAAIEEARAEWSTTPQKWAERRKAARKRIANSYSLAQMVRAYEEVWREVAGKG